MEIKTLELKGYKSLRAFNAFNALVLGLKMLPAYMGESYEDFLNRLQEMPEEDQRKMIREAASFVALEEDEVKALVCFAADSNGVPFTAENMKRLSHTDLLEIIVAVCMEITKIKVDFVSEKQKKNLKISV